MSVGRLLVDLGIVLLLGLAKRMIWKELLLVEEQGKALGVGMEMYR